MVIVIFKSSLITACIAHTRDKFKIEIILPLQIIVTEKYKFSMGCPTNASLHEPSNLAGEKSSLSLSKSKDQVTCDTSYGNYSTLHLLKTKR